MNFMWYTVFFYLFVTCDGQTLSEGLGSVKTLEREPHTSSQYDKPVPQPQMVQQFGYDIESFDVVTEDSYILKIFHMTKAKNCTGELLQPPVILTHGILQDSDVWFDAGPDAGLGYILADDCYDVWLSNVRGNFYGRRHKTLDPNTSAKFWDFSYDEMGYYDIPAILDFVLAATDSDVVNYLGFSQGCTTYYIMCDRRPDYCDKSQLMISIAPLTRQLNTKAIGFRVITTMANLARAGLEREGFHEVLPKGGFVQTALADVCQLNNTYDLCQAILVLFDARHPGSIDQPTLKQLFYHLPAGTSVKNFAHFGQALTAATFKYFDYGPMENMVRYGSHSPPTYNIGATTIPTVVIYGNNDGIVGKDDVEWVVSQLPNLLEAFEVGEDMFTHLDQTDSYYVPDGTLPKIRQYLQDYSY